MTGALEVRISARTGASLLAVALLATGSGCGYRERPDDAYRRSLKTVEDQMPHKPHTTEIRETRYANGALRERFSVYRDDKGKELMHGVYTRFHPNGRKKIECEFRDDDLVSSISKWYDNGQLRASVFSPRIVWKQGSETQWLANGRKGSEFVYESGIAKTERWWYPNGQLAIERTVLDKEVRGTDGQIMIWRSNGDKLREARWSTGWNTKVRIWDDAGRVSAWRSFD